MYSAERGFAQEVLKRPPAAFGGSPPQEGENSAVKCVTYSPPPEGESRPRRASPIGRSINRRRQGVAPEPLYVQSPLTDSKVAFKSASWSHPLRDARNPRLILQLHPESRKLVLNQK